MASLSGVHNPCRSLLSEAGLSYNDNTIAGAHSKRRGDAGPVRG